MKKKKKIKPSGFYWREMKKLAKVYKAKIVHKEKTIYVHWQLADGAPDLRKFARRYNFKIQTHL